MTQAANWQLPLFYHCTIAHDVLYRWLREAGSLTKRAKQICEQVQVEVITSGWQKISRYEANLIRTDERKKAFIREIFMVCDGQPWWYTRTIAPRTALTGPLQQLPYLRGKPLADLLFSSSRIRRQALEIAPISAEHYEYKYLARHLTNNSDSLWGRRSRIFCADQPLLLTEIFLPAMHRYLRARPK